MITSLNAKNFKSWRDTEGLKVAPITGLFGANSSGKTSIIQILLLLKQTAESSDRSQVLRLGDTNSVIDLGSFADVLFGHSDEKVLQFSNSWKFKPSLIVKDPSKEKKTLFETNEQSFVTEIASRGGQPVVQKFEYSFGQFRFGMKRVTPSNSYDDKYELISEGYSATRTRGRSWPLPFPMKCYGFPDEARSYYQNTGFLPDLTLSFEQLMSRIAYLGPLREYPRSRYLWGGEAPKDVGARGELAIPALLAARKKRMTISMGQRIRQRTVEERVAEWLKQWKMIHSFSLKPIAKNRKEYEVRVKTTPSSAEVSLTDVGFGVSQVLPVIVLCHYVKEGSTILLEQPEIHLHPSVQAGLADMFLDVVKRRKVQIILESHSEHLLRRLQRRIAEGYDEKDIALSFCHIEEGESKVTPLDLDLLGNIANWPKDFFGDLIGDAMATTEAAMKRKKQPTAK